MQNLAFETFHFLNGDFIILMCLDMVRQAAATCLRRRAMNEVDRLWCITDHVGCLTDEKL